MSDTTEAARIVVIEDEPAIALPLVDRLRDEGHDVVHAPDGNTGLAEARAPDVALVLLDLMLPGRNGSDVLSTLRSEGNAVPVICLTARTAESDRVAHLLDGADDYVTKPFSLDEVCARVVALLRRAAGGVPAQESASRLWIGDLLVDLPGHTVQRGDRREKLSTLEAAILSVLLDRRGRATSRAELLRRVWGRYATVSDRTIDFHVKNLRRKIEITPEAPELILTDHGIGYRFAG